MSVKSDGLRKYRQVYAQNFCLPGSMTSAGLQYIIKAK